MDQQPDIKVKTYKQIQKDKKGVLREYNRTYTVNQGEKGKRGRKTSKNGIIRQLIEDLSDSDKDTIIDFIHQIIEDNKNAEKI